jgi:hypothetical protein
MKNSEDTKLWVGEEGWIKRDRTRRVVEVGLGEASRGTVSVLLNFHRRALITVGNTSELLPHDLCKPLVRELQVNRPISIGQLMKIERMAQIIFKDDEPPFDRRGRYSKKKADSAAAAK